MGLTVDSSQLTFLPSSKSRDIETRKRINQTGCSVSEDTLQYRLEESVSHRRTRQVTQLFTYLLTHTLFSSCIRR